MQAINHELKRVAPPKALPVARALQEAGEPVVIKGRPRFGPVEPGDPCFGCVDWFMYDRASSKGERAVQVPEQAQELSLIHI